MLKRGVCIGLQTLNYLDQWCKCNQPVDRIGSVRRSYVIKKKSYVIKKILKVLLFDLYLLI